MSNTNRNPEWTQRLLSALHLLEAPSDQCRDTFLKDVFASLTPPEYYTTTDTSTDGILLPINKAVKFRSYMKSIADLSPETQLLENINLTEIRSRSHSTVTMPKSIDLSANIDINRLMRDRIGGVANLLGTMAVLYALNNLRSILHTLRHIWHPQATYDKSLHMFSWSIKDYLGRFNLKNRAYCDTFIKQVGDQMECVKYRKDLGEIIRLLDYIILDVSRKRELCENSIKVIQLVDCSEVNIEYVVEYNSFFL